MNRRSALIFLGGLAALAAAVVVAVPLLVPTGALRTQIEQRVSAATGRSFRIHGGLRFTVLPVLGLAAQDVTLANAPGGRAPQLVAVEQVRIGARFWPLLSGRIEVERIVLSRPHIALEVARDGRANWQLEKVSGGGTDGGVASKAQFAGVSVEDGTIDYDNAKLGVRRAIAHLDARIDLTRLDAPAGVTGSFDFRGRRLGYAVTIGTPALLLGGRSAKANIALTSPFLNAGFLGTIASDGTLSGVGSLRTPSLGDVAAWLGNPVAAGRGLRALDLRGRLAVRERNVSLEEIKAKLDGTNATGRLAADLRGNIPAVEGVLTVDRLDLDTYLQQDAPGHAGGPAAPAGWSRTPFKLDFAKRVDGRIVLNAGQLSVRHLKLQSASIAIVLDGGVLRATINPMQLYGGTGNATLGVDLRGPVPVFADKLTFANISMAPFLADSIGAGRIDGRGTILLDVTARGSSPDQVMRSLSGKGSVAIGAGAIRGVDMGLVARSIASVLSAGATANGAETRFSRFTGSFAIANGVLANNDLKLASDFLNMTGAGRLDLGNRTIDYRIEPKASIGGRLKLLDVGVPFVITGGWDAVHYRPDIAGAVSGLVESVIDKGSQPIGGLLKGLTGPADKTKAGKKTKSNTVGDKLEGLFGIH